MDAFLLLLLAFGFGALHAFDADHLAAVGSFVSKYPSPRQALGFGIRWAIGHSMTLGALALIVILLRLHISATVARTLEICVGFAMLVLGLWVLAGLRSRKIHVHIHEHDAYKHGHFHSHARASDHRHEHSVTLLGGLHGASGTAAFLVLIPVSFLTSPWLAAGYVVVFSIGLLGAMSAYAYWTGRFFEQMLQRSVGLHRICQACAGLTSCVVGVWWLVTNL